MGVYSLNMNTQTRDELDNEERFAPYTSKGHYALAVTTVTEEYARLGAIIVDGKVIPRRVTTALLQLGKEFPGRSLGWRLAEVHKACNLLSGRSMMHGIEY